MDKVKRSHVILIAVVILLTIYNILPTLLYYSKPLSKPIGQKEAMELAHSITKRVDGLKQESIDWVRSFSKNLGVKPKSIEIDPQNEGLIVVDFAQPKDAQIFKSYLPKAGALIPFVPAQLSLAKSDKALPTQAVLERRIQFNVKPELVDEVFQYVPKKEQDQASASYTQLASSRLSLVALDFAGNTENASLVQALAGPPSRYKEHKTLEIAQAIVSFEKNFSDKSALTKRYFQSFSQSSPRPKDAADTLRQAFSQLSQKLEKHLHQDKEVQKGLLSESIETLQSAIQIVQRKADLFNNAKAPLELETVSAQLNSPSNPKIINFGSRNPYIDSMRVDTDKGEVLLTLHKDVEKLLNAPTETTQAKTRKDKLHRLVINEIAQVSHQSGEKITPQENGYSIALHELSESEALLTLDLGQVAKSDQESLIQSLQTRWQPTSADLTPDAFPIWDYATYSELSPAGKKFGLLVYAPVIDSSTPIKGFKNSSMYVVVKGLNDIYSKYQDAPDSEQASQFLEEFNALERNLQQMGYQLAYQGQDSNMPREFQKDLVYEKPNYYADFIAATRENFKVQGNAKFASLELVDVQQRIHAENKIESQIHDELIKWNDDYQAAQVDLQDPRAKFMIPPPTKNIYWDNFKLSAKEYFRGDTRKILKWGLDLSGGKSILIGLRDQNNRKVTNKAEITEGVNELTQRVNKMGLSEVDIRTEGNNIALDFPSSKGLSAAELIKGSTMYFHVVNEKFASSASPYYAAAQAFLQEVWNEAVITNRKDIEGLNEIAWKHLGGSEDGQTITPRTEQAKLLYENGFVLQPPQDNYSTSELNEEISKIVPYAGQDYTDWRGQTNPLLIVFNNFALEGAQIENIRTGYDSKDGNTLAFNVKGSHTNRQGVKVNPRETFYKWTALFAKDRVAQTEYEKYTPQRGWRLSIVLNGRVINDPQLNQALKDNVQVTGGFTQHEVNRLAADLKAGSLSFKPEILAESNVSADLGQKERAQGIRATLVALLCVIVLMVLYYRFSGLIASIAVLFNLLIIWAVLQNLQATLTLSGIAGIILTLGMAVDANVLVFERIREELKNAKSLASAIHSGYKQAFSAIFDSNVTTLIAALILLNFDTGPIKGLAITLTIGITSSMFTALFMTRVFFAYWVKKTKATTLNMAKWFQVKTVNFLKQSKYVSAFFGLTIVIGCTLLAMQHRSILGMDFTGGYSLTVQLEKQPALRKSVEEALVQAGARSTDFQIRELGDSNTVRIQLSSALEERGKPFYGMPTLQEDSALASWQSNPRIQWTLSALKSAGLTVTPESLQSLDKNWSEMSGQMSATTRNNALIGLSLALFFILVYISFRFEVKFAISTILCILHDVLITLAILAILHLFGVPIQINMQIIAALMTIIGYSLNDTIIVFDRIREEKKLMRRAKFSELINYSLSATLNRTLMTSLTTFIVLFALLLLGGAKIFDFSLMMSIGVIVGTLSSLYVAPLLLLFFHAKETGERVSIPKVLNGSTS